VDRLRQHVAGGAAAILGVTVAILIVAVFVATPGQDNRVPAVEIGVVGLLTALGVAGGRGISAPGRTATARWFRCCCCSSPARC
jgi:peptidoglycan/LPS O-acetylase OafA/YrhL